MNRPVDRPARTGQSPTAPAPGCTCFKLRRLTRRVTALYDDEIGRAGMKTTQYSLLNNLMRGPLTLSALANRLAMDRTTLTRNLKPLLEQRWIEEARGADARSKQLAITPAGRAAVERARPHWRAAQRTIERTLDPDLVARLHALLDEAARRVAPLVREN
jgi:DNA-binding MarR family transcriptional regulator